MFLCEISGEINILLFDFHVLLFKFDDILTQPVPFVFWYVFCVPICFENNIQQNNCLIWMHNILMLHVLQMYKVVKYFL